MTYKISPVVQLAVALQLLVGSNGAIGAGVSDSTRAKNAPLSPALSANSPLLYTPALDDGTIWYRESRIHKTRLGIFLGGLLLADAYAFKKYADTWYNTPRSNFHFHEWRRDSREYQQMDKLGHIMDAYFSTHTASRFFRWAGLSAKKSFWYGALTGFWWMMQVEIVDGFYKNWGFSVLDFSANVVGVGFALLQLHHPGRLNAIRFKISYWPSPEFKRKEYSQFSRNIVDDYEGITIWLTANIHDLLPQRWQQAMPGWLKPWGIAVGHGAEGIARNVFGGYREIFLGLDFDLTKIPTGNSSFLKFLKHEVNFVRMPLPAVRIAPGKALWYGIYF